MIIYTHVVPTEINSIVGRGGLGGACDHIKEI